MGSHPINDPVSGPWNLNLVAKSKFRLPRAQLKELWTWSARKAREVRCIRDDVISLEFFSF